MGFRLGPVVYEAVSAGTKLATYLGFVSPLASRYIVSVLETGGAAYATYEECRSQRSAGKCIRELFQSGKQAYICFFDHASAAWKYVQTAYSSPPP